MKKAKQTGRSRRHFHIRRKVKGTGDRPRLAVFRSNRHMYVQAINDEDGKVITGFSTLSGVFKDAKVEGDKKNQAKELGKILAQELTKRGIKKIVFDRAGYKYHGRVKALAEAAREAGLEF